MIQNETLVKIQTMAGVRGQGVQDFGLFKKKICNLGRVGYHFSEGCLSPKNDKKERRTRSSRGANSRSL